MPLNQIMKGFADSVGLKTEEEFAHGVFNGYYLTVYNTAYDKGAFINFSKHASDGDVGEETAETAEETESVIEGAVESVITKTEDAVSETETIDETVEEKSAGETETAEETVEETVSFEEATVEIGKAEGDPESDSEESGEDINSEETAEEEAEDDETEDDGVRDFEFANEFQALAQKYEVKEHEIDDNGISFETPVSLTRFRELLDQTAALLEKYGYAGVTHCSSCGKEFSSDARRVYRDKFNYLVCADCASDLLEEQERENEIIENELSGGSRGKAILFSLLSSLVLAVVMVALYKYILPAVPVWGDFQPGFIACVIPFAMAGVNMVLYKNIGKKAGAERFIVSLLIALVFTVCAQYICSVVQFVRSGARTLAEAKSGVFPLTSTQLANAKAEILKTPLFYDTEWYMFYKYLIVDICAVLIGVIGFSFSTLKKPDKSLKVEEADIFEGENDKEEDQI